MSTPEAAKKPHIRVYRCSACTIGLVIPTNRDGRFVTYRGVVINVPMTMFIPRCSHCKAEIIDPATEKVLNGVLEDEYKRHEKMIGEAFERLRRRKGTN